MPSEKLASAENLLKGNLASAWNILEGSSGDYTDLGIARRFGGAAGAYSLRDIGAMNGRVIKVRRDVDGQGSDPEEDFSANQVSSGALEDWVNGKLESTLPADVDTAAAAYSLRKVKASYAEDAVRIRRSSDDAEVNVAFDSDDKVSSSSSISVVSGSTTATDLNGFLNEVFTVGVAVEGGSGGSRPDSFSNATNSSFTATVTATAGGYFPYKSAAGDAVTVSFDLVLSGGASPSINTSLGVDTVATRAAGTAYSSSGSYTFTLNCNASADHIRFADSDDGTFAVTNFRVTSHTHQAFVHTWYDQAGSNDATQTTADNQPKIAEDGALLADGIDFAGSNDELRTSTDIDSSHPITVVSLSKPDAVNKRIWESVDNTVISYYGGGSEFGMTAGTNLASASGLIQTNKEYLLTHLLNTTSSKIFANAVEVASGNAGSNAFSGNFSIGGTSSSSFDGTMKELIVYTSNQSDNRFKIESNINNYYGLYNDANELDSGFAQGGNAVVTPNGFDGFTGRGDKGAGVKTAVSGVDIKHLVRNNEVIYISFNAILGSATPTVSLRKNTLGGALASDAPDSGEPSVVNGFNSFALVSDVTNAEFCTFHDSTENEFTISDFKISRIARNGFVETWYDQSNNGRDMTQGTAADQPHIVENGGICKDPSGTNPTVKFVNVGTNLGSTFLENSSTIAAGETALAYFTVMSTDSVINRTTMVGSSTDFCLGGSNQVRIRYNGNTDTFDGGIPLRLATRTNSFVASVVDASKVATNHLNGTSETNSSAFTDDALLQLQFLGENSSSASNDNFGLQGTMSEIILYLGDKSDEVSEIKTDINNYYDIF